MQEIEVGLKREKNYCHLASLQKIAFYCEGYLDHPVWIRTCEQAYAGSNPVRLHFAN